MKPKHWSERLRWYTWRIAFRLDHLVWHLSLGRKALWKLEDIAFKLDSLAYHWWAASMDFTRREG